MTGVLETRAEPAGTTARRPERRRRGLLPFSGWHLLLAPTAVVFAIPFVQMFLASVTPAADLNRIPTPPHACVVDSRSLAIPSVYIR